MKGSTPAYKKWYAANKDEFAARRRERYKNDSEYREKIIAKRRESIARAKKPIPVIPPEYVHTLPEAAEAIGVSLSTLLTWREKNYMPTPAKYAGRMMFTQHQVSLLSGLKSINPRLGGRLSTESVRERKVYVSYIHRSWEG